MNKETLMTVLQAPIITEKSAGGREDQHLYIFKVRPDADKPNVRKAVELMFNTKVDTVRIVNVKGKTKRFGRTIGKRSGWKKAYVTLAKGEEGISSLGGVEK